MPTPTVIPNATIADAVVDALNAATFSLEFTAARVWKPIIALEEMGAGLYVRVAPLGRTPNRSAEPMGRGHFKRNHDVDVGIIQRCDTEDRDAVDVLAYLVDELAAWGDNRPLSVGGVQARITGVAQMLVDGDDYDAGQFSSLVRFTIELVEPAA